MPNRTAEISWVDCVQINNTKYHKDINNSIVEASSVGNKISEQYYLYTVK